MNVRASTLEAFDTAGWDLHVALAEREAYQRSEGWLLSHSACLRAPPILLFFRERAMAGGPRAVVGGRRGGGGRTSGSWHSAVNASG